MIVTVGVDPGESTGLVVLYDGKKEFVYQGEPGEALNQVRYYLALHSYTDVKVNVAYENYIITKKTGTLSQQPTPLKVIGALEQEVKALRPHIRVELHKQISATAKRFAPNGLLRSLGLRVTKEEVGCPDANDVMDAMRHAVLNLGTKNASLYRDMLIASQNRV